MRAALKFGSSLQTFCFKYYYRLECDVVQCGRNLPTDLSILLHQTQRLNKTEFSSDTSVNLYHRTRRHTPEDDNFHAFCHVHIKSHHHHHPT
jgi:hypothetical protein